MFKYKVGQTLRIKIGRFEGVTFTLQAASDLQMSGGIAASPEYYCKQAGGWFFEDEVELVEEGKGNGTTS